MKQLVILIRKIYRRVILEIKNTDINFNKLYIYKIDLTINSEKAKGYEILKAKTIFDLKEIIEERKGNFGEMYYRWLQLGYRCCIAKEGNSTVGCVWLNNTNEVPLELGYYQKLINREEAGLIDAYVLKEKRGKGVYKVIWDEVLREARSLGITTLYGYILYNNVQSIKVHYNLGMKYVYHILYYYKIFWFRIYYLKTLKYKTNILDLVKGIL